MSNTKKLVDWSKHELRKEILGDPTVNSHSVFELKVPNTRMNQVTFINAEGVCAVTGDYGNWIFCRTFNPETNCYMEPSYMAEKARIASNQSTHQFDYKGTIQEIKDKITEILIEGGALTVEDDNHLPEYTEPRAEQFEHLCNADIEHIKWLVDCIEYAEHNNEQEYIQQASDSIPNHLCTDSIIVCREIQYWFRVVNEAWNEIRDRCAKQKETTNA